MTPTNRPPCRDRSCVYTLDPDEGRAQLQRLLTEVGEGKLILERLDRTDEVRDAGSNGGMAVYEKAVLLTVYLRSPKQ